MRLSACIERDNSGRFIRGHAAYPHKHDCNCVFCNRSIEHIEKRKVVMLAKFCSRMNSELKMLDSLCTDDIWYIVGAIKGDGYFIKDRRGYEHIGISMQSLHVIKEIQRILSSIGFNCGIRFTIDKRYSIAIYKKSFITFFSKYLSIGNKIISGYSKSCLRSNSEARKLFLKSIFDCEGWVSIRAIKSRLYCNIGMAMNEKDTIEFISELLSLECIHHRTYFYEKMHSINIGSKKSVIDFQNNIGFIHSEKDLKIRGFLHEDICQGLALENECRAIDSDNALYPNSRNQ